MAAQEILFKPVMAMDALTLESSIGKFTLKVHLPLRFKLAFITRLHVVVYILLPKLSFILTHVSQKSSQLSRIYHTRLLHCKLVA